MPRLNIAVFDCDVRLLLCIRRVASKYYLTRCGNLRSVNLAMQHAARESMKEAPMGVSFATAAGLGSTEITVVPGPSGVVARVVVVASVLGLQALVIIGLLLIVPGCGQPI